MLENLVGLPMTTCLFGKLKPSDARRFTKPALAYSK